jgi:hypothetical protein
LEGVGQYATPAWGAEKTLEDLLKAFGTINITGNVFSPYNNTMTLKKTAGETFRFSAGSGVDMNSPNSHVDLQQAPVTDYHYHLGQGAGGYTTLYSTVDNTHYDLNGVLTAVPAGKFTVQRIYYFPRSGIVDIVYGQKYYDTLALALSNMVNDVITINDDNRKTLFGSVLRGYVIVSQDCTDLSVTTKASVLPANVGIGNGASGTTHAITKHSDLTDLNADDHTQYLNNTRGDLRYTKIIPTVEPLTPVLGDLWFDETI